MVGTASAGAREQPIRVALVDDHRLMLDGLSTLLSAGESGIDVVAAEQTWAGLIANPALPVDVVVLDLHLDDNIPIGTKLRALRPSGSATIVMSRHTDGASITAAFRAGASGFVAKSESADDLIDAIRDAVAHTRHLSPALAATIDDYDPAPQVRLGARELNALVLYAKGRSIAEVAAHMETTQETVKSYIKRGRRKYKHAGVDLGSRRLLRHHGIREGWFPLE